ncbi:MAG: hypothetical protein H0U95_09375 [Bacteroidetes bacterium]|nr:hypothetical protein [Bacteroidota bacterium]
MKNLLRIIILTIITSFIFSSCGKQMSITKRKYNKGYYVSHSHKRGDVKSQPATASVKNNSTEQLQAAAKKTEGENINLKKQDASVVTAEASKPVASGINSTDVRKEKTSSNVLAKKFMLKKLEQVTPSKLFTQEVKKRLSASSDSEALSLIWIIILVVLILYLIGFLFDGYGLGGAFHLLAVIFLVLLILWLLRVI